MSRPTYRQKAGVIFALVALALGVMAGAALGWAGEEQPTGNDHGKKGHGEKPPPEEVTPPTETTPPPVVTTPQASVTPPGTTTAPPVTSQGTPPSTTTPPTTPQSPPTEQTSTPPTTPPTTGQPPTTSATPPLAPVAERKSLAETGLKPGLIALLGAVCLAGGGFLFRRALVND